MFVIRRGHNKYTFQFTGLFIVYSVTITYGAADHILYRQIRPHLINGNINRSPAPHLNMRAHSHGSQGLNYILGDPASFVIKPFIDTSISMLIGRRDSY